MHDTKLKLFLDESGVFEEESKIPISDIFPIKDIDEKGNLISLVGDLVVVYEISSNHNPLDEKQNKSLISSKDFFLKSIPDNIEIIYHVDRNEATKNKGHDIKNEYLKPIGEKYNSKIKDIYDNKNIITLSTRRGLGDDDAELRVALSEAENSLNTLASVYNLRKLNVEESISFLSSFFDKTIEPFPNNELIRINDAVGSLDLRFLKKNKYGLSLPADYYIIGDQIASILTIKTYSSVVNDQIFKRMVENKFPFRYSIVASSINQSNFVEIAKKDIRFYTRQPHGFASKKINELTQIVSNLEADETKIFNFLLLIEIRADDLETLKRRCSIIAQSFSGDFKLKKESVNLPNAFFSRLPTYGDRVNVKSVKIQKEPLNLFFEITPSSTVKRNSPFGFEPVCQFLDNSRSLHNFYFHKEMTNPKDMPAGHTLVVGETGSGKTSFISFLLANALKYPNLKMINFDQRQGLRIFTEFAGGQYSDLASGEVKLNPLQLIKNEKNIRFLKQFIFNLAGLKREQYDEVSDLLDDCINEVMSLPKRKRFLVELKDNFYQSELLNTSLKKWYVGGDYGYLFNGVKDSLSFNNPITSFDMTGIVNIPELLGLVMEYITHKIDSELSGNPLLIFIDEMPNYLKSPIFQNLIETYSEQARKKNWVLLMAIQNFGTLAKHKSADAILGSLENLILFPSSDAYNDLDSRFSELFSQDEIRWLNQSSHGRQIMIKKKSTGKSSIVDVDLNHLDNYLNIFNSSADEVRRMLEIKRKNKAEWRKLFLGLKDS